jgi:hypothetical protein
VFVDKGYRVISKTDDKAAIAVMLEYASEKYGGSLKLNGTEEFKKQCAEVAAEKGMNIIIHPDKYHQMMMDRKAELAASIERGPQQTPAAYHQSSEPEKEEVVVVAQPSVAVEENMVVEQGGAINESATNASLDADQDENNQESSDAFEGERNPLGASPSRFDEVRDVPAYMRHPVEKIDLATAGKEKTPERIDEQQGLDSAGVKSWNDFKELHSKSKPLSEEAKQILLEESEKRHKEHGLSFERDFEGKQIDGLSEDKAQTYLNEALASRIERANESGKSEQDLNSCSE